MAKIKKTKVSKKEVSAETVETKEEVLGTTMVDALGENKCMPSGPVVMEHEILEKEKEDEQEIQPIIPNNKVREEVEIETEDVYSTNEDSFDDKDSEIEKLLNQIKVLESKLAEKNKTTLSIFDGNVPDNKKTFEGRRFGYNWNGMEIDD